jgi:hypothetical protein
VIRVEFDFTWMRRAFRPLWREACITGFRWALREIDPMHRDVPYIVRRLAELIAERGPEPDVMKESFQWN